MLQSAKLRLRAPSAGFSRRAMSAARFAVRGPTLSSGTSGANNFSYRYSYGAGVTSGG